MLQLIDITYGYPASMATPDGEPEVSGEPENVLKGISLDLRRGERLALIGPNGSGKSTLLRCACGLASASEGRIDLDGHEITSREDNRALREHVGMVGQDPDNQMVASTVFEEVAFGPCNLGLPPDEVRSRVAVALEQCDLEGFDDRDVATLSGGQRQRVALAGVLAMHPDYLLCDEPCSMLDTPSRHEMIDVLEHAVQQGCGVIHVTHELADVIAYDRIAVLRDGMICWQGSPIELLLDEEACDASAVLVSPWLQTARTLIRCGSLSREAPLGDPAACARLIGEHGDAARKAAQTYLAAATRSVRPVSYPVQSPDVSEDVLAVHGAGHSYDRGRHKENWVFRDADLTVRPGEVVMLAGPTGSGKSTLARIAAGLLQPVEGTTTLNGKPVIAGQVAYAFQRAEDQLFADTVLEDVMFAPHNDGCTQEEARERAERALERVGLDPDVFGGRSPFSLSGGQMRRVAIAGVIAMEAPYMVFDEPTVGLDAPGLNELVRLIGGLTADGMGILIVSHDVARAPVLADRAVFLEGGAIRWRGDAADLADVATPDDGVALCKRVLNSYGTPQTGGSDEH